MKKKKYAVSVLGWLQHNACNFISKWIKYTRIKTRTFIKTKSLKFELKKILVQQIIHILIILFNNK